MCTDSMETYIQTLDRYIEIDDGIEPVRLYALKERVNSYNFDRIEELKGDSEVYVSHDQGQISTINQCFAPESLELKIDAQVMLKRNLNEALVNGSIGPVIGFRSIKDSEKKYPIV